jgi:hypothetical protein
VGAGVGLAPLPVSVPVVPLAGLLSVLLEGGTGAVGRAGVTGEMGAVGFVGVVGAILDGEGGAVSVEDGVAGVEVLPDPVGVPLDRPAFVGAGVVGVMDGVADGVADTGAGVAGAGVL